MSSGSRLAVKKQRKKAKDATSSPLATSPAFLTSLAQTVRQLHLLLSGARRKNIYRHHLFYRKAVHALFCLKKILSVSPSLAEVQQGMISASSTRVFQYPSHFDVSGRAYLQAETLVVLRKAGAAVAEEISAQRIDTLVIASALLTIFAVAFQMLIRN